MKTVLVSAEGDDGEAVAPATPYIGSLDPVRLNADAHRHRERLAEQRGWSALSGTGIV